MSRSPLASLALMLALSCTPGMPRAGAGLEAVWFPDGHIRWFAELPANATAFNPLPFLTRNQVNTVIEPTLDWMEERLPLTFQRRFASSASNLIFKRSIFAGVGSGAWAFGYWAPDAVPKDIAFFSAGAVNRATVAHEVGHALGMPHEMQRLDAGEHVDILFAPPGCPNDPFNYGGIPHPAFGSIRLLSPFDPASRMMYRNGCVVMKDTGAPPPEPRYRGADALFSRHDINSIYRTYAKPLGKDEDRERFGHATAVLDLDDDGFEDVVVAAKDVEPGGTRALRLYVFRGVVPDPSEGGAGRRFAPWFAHDLRTGIADPSPASLGDIVLATGDFDGDARARLAVGYEAGTNAREVVLLEQASGSVFTSGRGAEPWGVRGLVEVQRIRAQDVAPGFGGAASFATALTVGRMTDEDRDDLLIGWPGGRQILGGFNAAGVVVHLAGRDARLPLVTLGAPLTLNPERFLLLPPGAEPPRPARFGASLAVMRNPTTLGGSGGTRDRFIVGAPGADRVYVYGRAHARERPVVPPVMATIDGPANSFFGHALGTFGVRLTGPSWRDPAVLPHYRLAIGAPSDTGPLNGRTALLGAVHLYAIDYGFEQARPIRMGRVLAPRHRRSSAMAFGHSLAVLDTGSDFGDVQIGIGAPGAGGGGLVYAWQPLDKKGRFSTAGASLTPPRGDIGNYGESLAPITFRTQAPGGRRVDGFVIGAPRTLSSGLEAGAVQARLNEEAISARRWKSDRQWLTQRTRGDRPTQ